eukprot:CAMPEP_0117500086 /NCGR_PEP_ID=MMETSP0784-20121206/22591_1 /TAXON_ID=39447 /ORGANISM="" /LENGTH=166 /DNA_ID=CAMNT_0005295277 /DNA_START=19 /DNA_END=518 /DNA_ORIENTATION=-
MTGLRRLSTSRCAAGIAGATCMVLDEDALPLTRTWCIFEVLQTLELSSSSSLANFDGLTLVTSRGVLGHPAAHCYDIALSLVDRLSKMSVEEATASREHDDIMIKDLARNRAGGIDGTNQFIRDSMYEVLRQVQANFQQDIGTLGRSLQAHMQPHAQGTGDRDSEI